MEKCCTCCFTGHRPKFMPWGYNENSPLCLKFKEDLKEILDRAIKSGFTVFLTGMAEGFDMIAGETILELKKQYPKVKLIAVVPCIGQEEKWSEAQKKRYGVLLNKCDEKVVLSKKYTPTCLQERNEYMVNQSSVVIACYNGKPSGTAKTVRYAKEKGCKVRIINPEDYR